MPTNWLLILAKAAGTWSAGMRLIGPAPGLQQVVISTVTDQTGQRGGNRLYPWTYCPGDADGEQNGHTVDDGARLDQKRSQRASAPQPFGSIQ